MKKYIPFLIITSILLVGCKGIQKGANVCETAWINGGSRACLENINCETIIQLGQRNDCGDPSGTSDCQEPDTIVGCQEKSSGKIDKEKNIIALCEKTGGKYKILDGGRYKCTCKNDFDLIQDIEQKLQLQSMGLTEKFFEEKGCMNQKTLCESGGGKWENNDYGYQDIAIKNEEKCSEIPGRKWFTNGYWSGCMITNRPRIDDHFGGCIKNNKRYLYYNGQLNEIQY